MNTKHFVPASLLICASGCANAQVVAPNADSPPQNALAPIDFEAVPWRPMPLLSPEARRAGVFPGGEGSQWPRFGVVISRSDPDFMLLPIDVGGLYRTTDGGRLWRQSSAGWNARGANHFAIDPKNANFVIGIGGNSLDYNANWGLSPHGIYVSSDKARSWKQTFAVLDGLTGLVAFDETSFDARANRCLRAYYVAPKSGLFRSEDGGNSWQKISDLPAELHLEERIPAQIVVSPSDGTVFLAGKSGLFRSQNRGQSFEKQASGAFWGLSLVENTLFASGDFGLQSSSDGGKSWQTHAARGIERAAGEPIRHINVHPLDARKMFAWVAGANWRWIRYISHDGGETFAPIAIEMGTANRGSENGVPGGLAVLPYNVRHGWFAWHPTQPDVAFGLGGDWVTKSDDGGKRFRWWNNGNNGIMVGSSFGFSKTSPQTVMLAFQDYNGAFTLDGGQTWNYRDVSGKGWGGHVYGGFAVDKDVMWAGESENWGPPRRTRISRDGGKTWPIARDKNGQECVWSGAEVSYADPKNPQILFASNWRSTDKGASWEKMADCDGVFTDDGRGGLLGRKGSALVRSTDGGASWQKIADVEGGFSDLAFDGKRGRFFVASQEKLKVWENGAWKTLETPRDQYGNSRVITVAADSQNSDIVYVGGPRNIYASSATIARSTDGGATWENLTAGDGPLEVAWIRVHPTTREAWVNGQCYGMWRLAPPQKLGAAPESRRHAPRQIAVPKAF